MRALITALLFAAALGAFAAAPARAEPTDITVRVVSKDAKFIGTSMGGMRIVLRDADTGEILASGVTSGGTGNTKLLMHENAGRRAKLSDASAAKFDATIDIDEPRRIEVDAYGPLGQPQAAHRVTATQWVVPGAHVTGGDGWVLELPGFVVDVLSPPAHVKLPAGTDKVDVRANVVMMCGCPVTPKGLWDADKFQVKALVKRNGKAVKTVDVPFAGETSQFATTLPVEEPGTYEVVVYAHDPGNGNTGLDRTTFIVD